MIEFREDCLTWSLRHTCFCHRRMWGGLLGWPGGVEMQRRCVGRRSTAAGCSVSVARRSCYPTVAHLRPWVARQRKSREKRPGGGEEGQARTWGSSRSSDDRCGNGRFVDSLGLRFDSASNLCAILISFILLSVQNNCNVQPHHMQTVGAVEVLLDLNHVV